MNTACALVAALAVAGAAPIPDLTKRVTDLAGALTPTERAQLESELAEYEVQTGHQFAVLIVPDIDGDVLEQYSLKVAEKWRLGDKKRDDGLLMLIAMKEHAIRIEVGYGLEGAVPDVVASRVIRDVMVPKMQQGDVDGAVADGLHALERAAQGESIGVGPSTSPRQAPDWSWLLGVLGILFFVLLALPRVVRAPLFAVAGAAVGFAVWSSWLLALALGAAGLVLGAVLPVLRGGGGFGGLWWLGGPWIGGGSSSWGGGGGGGFHGGGGGFGGGGASGRW